MNAKLIAKAIAELTLRQSARTSEIIENARQMVSKKYRGVSWNSVRALAQRYVAEAQGISLVEVTTASALATDKQDQFQQILDDKTFITFKTNNKILGGYVIKKNSQVLDGSFKAKLDKIKANI